MHKASSRNITMDMWLRRCTSSSQFSQEVVLDKEDLLTLILLRVPYRTLKSLKCVSKKWLSLITTPHFTRCLCNLLLPLRASGLFIQRPPVPCFDRSCHHVVYFVPLDNPNTPSPFKTLTFANDPFDPQRIRIRNSCNGLLLCSTCTLPYGQQIFTYVYNTSTNQLDILPQLPPSNGLHHSNLAFDPSNSPHYKVIVFVTTSQSDSIGDFHVYSSQTGTWSLSIHSFHRAPDMYLDNGVYWNKCINWLSDLNLKSEPSVSHGLYFNVDEGRLGTFPRPPKLTKNGRSYFGESEDHLHFIDVCPNATSLWVYEMKTDYSEWFIKYWIDLAPISKVFTEMTDEAFYDYENRCAVAVLSLIRRENFQEDSFLVLEIPGKAIRYNLVDTSFKVIWDFAVDFGLEKVHPWYVGRFKVCQYIEALSCV